MPASYPLRLALLIGVMFIAFLGAHPYITPSEARYIEIARQMAETGDWIVPHINGVPYFEKPPLFYWVQAAIFKLFGVHEFTQRLPTALLSVGLCLLTYELGKTLYTKRIGMAAGLALATSWLGFALSRVVMLDVPLTVCVTGVLLCFVKAVRKPDTRIIYLMYVFVALGVLTKGLVGVLIPGMVVFFWLLLTRQWALLKRLRIPTGSLLFLLIVLPWHFAAAARYPQFWQFYIVHEHFSRFLTDDHHRNQPWWFFPAVAMGGWMPWTAFFVPALQKAWAKRKNRDTLFLLLWSALPMLFFSLSHSKLVPYIYPIFPPLAVLVGAHLEGLWNHHWRYRLIALALATPIIGYAAQSMAPQLWRGSMKPLAQALNPRLKPGDEVALFITYRQDLPVYLNRNVTVVAYQGELAFGTSIEPKTQQWMIDYDTFWQRCRDHRLYVVMDQETYNAFTFPEGCRFTPLKLGTPLPNQLALFTNEEPHE